MGRKVAETPCGLCGPNPERYPLDFNGEILTGDLRVDAVLQTPRRDLATMIFSTSFTPS